MTEKIRGRGGRNGDHRDVLSVCIYTHTYVRVYTCRQTRVRGLSSEKRTANRTFFASCMIQPQYLISSAASSAKLYLLMVMPFRGTYLFILRGLTGWFTVSWLGYIPTKVPPLRSPFSIPWIGALAPYPLRPRCAFLPHLPPSERSTPLGASGAPRCVSACMYVCTACRCVFVALGWVNAFVAGRF